MGIESLGGWLQTILLASVRLTVGLAMTPLMGSFGIPAACRAILVLAFALLAARLHPALGLTGPTQVAQLMVDVGGEIAIGLVVSIGVHAAFAAFAVAGRLMDLQMGFGFGSVLDPVTKVQAPVIASGLSLLAVTLFFNSRAIDFLLAGIFRTFQLFPMGRPVAFNDPMAIVEASGQLFGLGFVMASPVVVALLMADAVVAVVSRNLPQMNVLFLSIPLKVLLGLFILAGSLRLMGPVVEKMLLLPMTVLDKV